MLVPKHAGHIGGALFWNRGHEKKAFHSMRRYGGSLLFLPVSFPTFPGSSTCFPFWGPSFSKDVRGGPSGGLPMNQVTSDLPGAGSPVGISLLGILIMR